MKQETEIILRSLRDFKNSDVVKNTTIETTLPNSKSVPRMFRGKEVKDTSLQVALDFLFRFRLGIKKMQKVLDDHNPVVREFLAIFKENLEDYEVEPELPDTDSLKEILKEK